MYFLVSGEGPTDIGTSKLLNEIVEGTEFRKGPGCVILEKIINCKYESRIPTPKFAFVSESSLNNRSAQLKASRKGMRLPGKKNRQETGYFFQNARALADIALEMELSRKEKVIAVLFRDSDGTNSSPKSLWDDKWNSMANGFLITEFDRGVPMLPKPKLEAWLICAFKSNPYLHCAKLENRSGNDASPNSLKGELNSILLDNDPCDAVLAKFDVSKISMPSFDRFLKRFEDVLSATLTLPID